MSAALHAPEELGDDFVRFLVHDRLEIISILRRLQAKRAQVTLNTDAGEFTLTVVLAVNPDFEELVFDCGSDPEANRALMYAERITAVANVDGIKVQFTARRPDTTIFEGRPALRMRLPEIVLRLQRRDFYRVPASLTCELAIECGESVRVLEMRVADLSLGGVALVTTNASARFEPGQLLESCRIGLGTLGTLAFGLEVRNVTKAATRSGGHQMRIGCAFTELPRAMETLVSRYIGQMERDRRAMT